MSTPLPSRWLTPRSVPVILLLIFFLFPAFNEGFHRPGSYEESETLPYAKHFAQPDYVAEDWYFNHPQPVRRPFHVLVYPLVKWLPLPAAAVTARLLGYLMLAGALTLIALKLKLGVLEAGVVIGAYLWVDQSLPPSEEWLFRKTESKVIAYALVLTSLAALLYGRLRSAGLLAGLATTMHIIVGGWGTLALGLSILSARLYPSWGLRAQALALWIAGAGGALYFVLARLGAPKASPDFDFLNTYVGYRMPHHLVPSAWRVSEDDVWLALLGVALLVILLRVATSGSARPARVTAHFALWTAVPYGLGFAGMMLPFGYALLHFYPFRVGSALVLLLGLMLAVPLLTRVLFRARVRVWVAGLAMAVFAAGAVENAGSDLKQIIENPHGGFWRGNRTIWRLRAVCDWVKENTEPGALIIASPYLDVVQYHCERPVAVTFRMAPSDAAGLEKWYRRLVDFNGGQKPESRGYSSARAIERRFRKLEKSQYQALGRKYGGRYLLLRERTDLDLPKLFENRTWTLYALNGPGRS